MIFIHTRIGECTGTIDILFKYLMLNSALQKEPSPCCTVVHRQVTAEQVGWLKIMAGAAVSRRLQTGGWLGCGLLGGWEGEE